MLKEQTGAYYLLERVVLQLIHALGQHHALPAVARGVEDGLRAALLQALF